MYDRENDTRKEQGRQVQQELEAQLRAFGDTMSDAFAHGFEGRGEDIGDRAYDVGKAAVHAANYGIGEAGRAFRKARDEARKSQNARQSWAKQTVNEGYADLDTTGMPGWFKQVFTGKNETTPVDEIRISAKKRYSAGCALLAVGITFAVIFGITSIACLAAAGAFVPNTALLQAIIQESVFSEGMLLDGAAAVGTMALSVVRITGWCSAAVTAVFVWMITAGASRLKTSKLLRRLADTAEGFDCKKGLPVGVLDEKKGKALKLLRKFIRKGWLNAWLDEKTGKFYLTAEDYRMAQEAAHAPQPQAEPETEKREVPLNLETARRFAAVLQQEKQLMRDEQGREELEHMQKTTTAICDWLETHPESLPKARRFAEYYIPTTLKLLHTYNDVQGQQGENADAIRRDIAGILHTLNQAYDTLYDTLLSDVAMNVSSEIAALQGMLASDGLTGGDFQ